MTDQTLSGNADAFEIGAAISRSDSAELFEATERATGAACVLKVYADAGQATREARALAALDGARAPQLLSRRTVNGRPALVMERAPGRTLEDWAASTPAGDREARLGAILAGLADALAEVHARGLAHGDLKPDHVLIGEDGCVRLIDFASAAAAGERASASGARWLTPGYSAPECDPAAPGDQPLGAWSDYFSVGAILFWLAEGHAPAEGDLDRPPSGLEGLAEAARRLLRREPSDRPLTGEEFRAVLLADMEVVEGPTETAAVADPRDPIPPTVRVRRRLPGQLPDPPAVGAPRRAGGPNWLAVAASLALLLAAGGAGYVYGWPIYQKLYKTDWVVDRTGAGDALTLAEALNRAGPDVRILLAAGEHPAAPIENRSVALGPVEGLAEPPVIVGGAERCLMLTGARAHLSGLKIARTSHPENGGCLIVQGGEAVLAGTAIERAQGAGLVIRGGATVRLSQVEVSNPNGAGLALEGGAEVEAAGLIVGGATGPGAVIDGGASLTGAGVKLIAAGASGLAVGGGGRVSLTGSEVDGAAGTGVELTEGAEADLTDMLIDSSGGAGVALYDGARLRMTGGTVAGSALTGVYAEGAARLTLTGVKVAESGEHGVLLLGLKGGEIAGAEIAGSKGVGLGVFPGVEVELRENMFADNAGGDVIDARPPETGGKPAEETGAKADDTGKTESGKTE